MGVTIDDDMGWTWGEPKVTPQPQVFDFRYERDLHDQQSKFNSLLSKHRTALVLEYQRMLRPDLIQFIIIEQKNQFGESNEHLEVVNVAGEFDWFRRYMMHLCAKIV